jgi:hypothetical protein
MRAKPARALIVDCSKAVACSRARLVDSSAASSRWSGNAPSLVGEPHGELEEASGAPLLAARRDAAGAADDPSVSERPADEREAEVDEDESKGPSTSVSPDEALAERRQCSDAGVGCVAASLSHSCATCASLAASASLPATWHAPVSSSSTDRSVVSAVQVDQRYFGRARRDERSVAYGSAAPSSSAAASAAPAAVTE